MSADRQQARRRAAADDSEPRRLLEADPDDDVWDTTIRQAGI